VTTSGSGYDLTGETLSRARRLDSLNVDLLFQADDIRKERTGVHARLTVSLNGRTLAWSSFNIERDEDRVRLSNSAHAQLAEKKEDRERVYRQSLLKNDLDRFCHGLWDAYLDANAPVMMGGSAERHAPAFVLRPYIIEGGGTIAFAPPGRGKSYVMMLIQVSIDAACAHLWPVRPARTLLINLERSPQSVRERLGNINEILGLRREREIPIINARGKSLLDVATIAERFIKDRAIEVVFVDSISRAGAGGLTDDLAGNRVVDTLNRIAPTWFALAHSPRGDDSHLFGTVMFEAGADVIVQLLSQQEEDGPLGIGLQVVKNNDIGKQPMSVHALEFDAAGLIAVRPARAGEFSEVESKRRLSLRDAVIEQLRDVGALDAHELASTTNYARTNIARLLARDTQTFIEAGRLGHKKLYALR
jgi:hypothetical protein